jgi:hypothetical protein
MADTILGNATSTQILAVNETGTSAIDFLGDTDWWKVYLTQGYSYQILVSGSQLGMGTLYDPYLGIYNNLGLFQYGVDDISSGVFRDAYTNTIPNSTGYFFVSAQSYGSLGVGSYTIILLQDQLASSASIATIPVNSISESARIGLQDDISDWYSVALTAGIQYQFDLIGSSNDGSASGLTLIDPNLYLRNSAGLYLAYDDSDGLGSNSRIFYTPTVSGKYFLDIQEYGNDSSGEYRIIVNANPTSGSMSLGVLQAGTIGFNGDVDRYSVSLLSGVTYGFSVDGSTLLDPYLEIQDSFGTNLGSDDNGGTALNALFTYTPTVSGVYYIAARESGNNATGNYNARVWQLPTVSISDASVTEGNTGSTSLVFTITLSAASPVDISVTVATLGTSTATSLSDYMPTTGTVTIAAGQISTRLTVQVLGDALFEPTESFYASLSNPVNVVLADSDGSGYIYDNDNTYTLATDGLLTYQWYLYPSTGINVFPVWNDYTGTGIRVAVSDQGIDPLHPDLAGNLLVNLGRNSSDLSIGGSPILSTDNHGTAVAGTIGAERNGSGVVGVAYEASLISIYGMSTSGIKNVFSYAQNFDVLNNSWGFAPQGTSYYALYGNWAFADNFLTPAFSAAGTALTNLAANGRGGLGTVVVQSAGNSFSVGDDTNLHNFQNSQYIITVAATDYAGSVTTYSSPGASVLVAAPGGGGTGWASEILTTDRIGTAGYNPSDYTYIDGTSFSAPIVSGVVALLLDANPNLGYRDVQEILAS